MADVVAPISYAHAHEQHMHDLRTYKWHTPPEIGRRRLLNLLVVFLAGHGRCLLTAAGGPAPSVAAVVLGRRINPDWGEWRPILQKIRDEPFRLDDCPFHVH
ncbi:MAG: hypothetical protein IRY90_12870 [Actinomadura rubrobrunea]|nr:hypothetical protein [Actinomadura rubrobrunea]